jgi:hypothetical protein
LPHAGMPFSTTPFFMVAENIFNAATM